MKKIYKPIFIIGCPRSGTSLLYQILRLHSDVAYITPITNVVFSKQKLFFEKPYMVNFLHYIIDKLPYKYVPNRYRGPYDGSLYLKNLPETNEGHRIWRYFIENKDHHYLNEDDVSEEFFNYLIDVVIYHLEIFNKERFLSKNPQYSLGIKFLNKIFPDSLFVHIVRDGRAVVNSILKRRRETRGEAFWWGAKPPNWRELKKINILKQISMQYLSVINIIETDANEVLSQERYYLIKYEHLVNNPKVEIEKLLEFLELRKENYINIDDYEYKFKRFKNKNWENNFSFNEKQEVNTILKYKLHELGYF